jgi:hypothetical protein
MTTLTAAHWCVFSSEWTKAHTASFCFAATGTAAGSNAVSLALLLQLRVNSYEEQKDALHLPHWADSQKLGTAPSLTTRVDRGHRSK